MIKSRFKINARGSLLLLLVALLALLSVDGLFAHDQRVMTLAYQNSAADSLKQGIKISGLLLILAGALCVARFTIPNPFSHSPFKNYARYLVACLPSIAISPSVVLSAAAWGLVAIQFLVLTVIFAPLFDKRMEPENASAYRKSICEVCFLFLKYFLLVALIAHAISPAYQLGEFIIKTDRFAGGTWFYWSPNLLTEFSAVVAATSLWSFFQGRKGAVASFFWFCIAITVLVLSHSRVSIFSFSVMVVSLFLMGRGDRILRSLYFIFFIVIAFALLSVSSFIFEYLLRGQTSDQLLAATGRIETYSVAWSIFSSSPEKFFIGSGFYVGGRFVVPEAAGRIMLSNVDQTLLEVAVNSGVLALAPFVWFFKDIFRGVYALLNQPDKTTIFVFCLSIALFFRALSGPTFHQLGFHLVFAVLIGSFVASTKIDGSDRALRHADGGK